MDSDQLPFRFLQTEYLKGIVDLSENGTVATANSSNGEWVTLNKPLCRDQSLRLIFNEEGKMFQIRFTTCSTESLLQHKQSCVYQSCANFYKSVSIIPIYYSFLLH